MKKTKLALVFDILFMGIIVANLVYAIIDGRTLAIILSSATIILYLIYFVRNYLKESKRD